MEKKCYLVIKEQIEDYDECRFGYPQITITDPVAVCETKELAENLVEKMKQDEADRFMDWLDEYREFIDAGTTDASDYDDPDRGDYYFIVDELPYYNDAS